MLYDADYRAMLQSVAQRRERDSPSLKVCAFVSWSARTSKRRQNRHDADYWRDVAFPECLPSREVIEGARHCVWPFKVAFARLSDHHLSQSGGRAGRRCKIPPMRKRWRRLRTLPAELYQSDLRLYVSWPKHNDYGPVHWASLSHGKE